MKDASSHWATFDAPVLDPTEHPPGRGIAERVGEALGCAVAIDVWRDVGWSIDVTVEGEALAIFIRNTKEHPDSWNVWDSLGEMYATMGDKGKAAANYRKALALTTDPVQQQRINGILAGLK